MRRAPPATVEASAAALLRLSRTTTAASAAASVPLVGQLQSHLYKSGQIPSAPTLTNLLISFYSLLALPSLSLRAFSDLPSAALPPASWHSVLSAFSRNSLPSAALSTFRSMLAAAVRPSPRSLPSAAKAAAELQDHSAASSVHCVAAKSPFMGDVFVGSAVVDMYCKCGLNDLARKAFDEMPVKNVVSWTALICGYADHGRACTVLELFRAAALEADAVNDFTLSAVIRVCALTTLLAAGRHAHARAIKAGFDASPFVGSALVSLYSKCGAAALAYQVFDIMPLRNIGVWNAALIASAQHGHTKLLFDRFEQMQGSGFRPNHITFLCVLTACSHAGLVSEGKQYFALMKEYKIEPEPEHYAAMVDLLGRVGNVQEALEFIHEMPVQPTEAVWNALLMACRIKKDADTAKLAAQRLFETEEGSRSSGAHMLLCSTLASAGRHADSALARKAMRDAGVRKETAMSWLEDKSEVHVFVSADRKHVLSDDIYQKLAEVEQQIEKAGYAPDTAGVVRDVELDEKKASVRYHSERLAIALGLLIVPEGVDIRVMKNLRVCVDCHVAIKYISKCTSRVIVLRDNRRFHRFEDGICSCGDFW